MNQLLLAASTQRTIGMVLAVFVVAGVVLYWIFNWFQGRAETGSEVETAINRKDYLSDDELETKKLDKSLFYGLTCLVAIGIALPLYWMGEPGRHDGLVEENDQVAISRGQELYEERCSTCHGTVSGPGGTVDYTLADDSGLFLGDLQWKTPSLAAVLYRYSVDEVKYVLNYGRPNTPMPAWGAPGGGPFTTQEIDEVVAYLAHEQIPDIESMRERVNDGVITTVRELLVAADPTLTDDPDALSAAVAAEMARILDDPVAYGEVLFNNEGDNGVYGCARCHTPGWSYDADEVRETEGNMLISAEVPGGGAFAPNLFETTRQFDTFGDHQSLVTLGSQNGVAYGNFGQGDGGGQMPAFGICVADRDAGERDFIARDGFCDKRGGEGMLTQEQVAAIVAFEREVLSAQQGALSQGARQ